MAGLSAILVVFGRKIPSTPEWLTMKDMMGAMGGGAMGHDMMKMDSMGQTKMDHSQMSGGMAMDHSMHGMQQGSENPLAKPSSTIRHARTEYGASVDQRVDTPSTNLDDPGIGLRNLSQRGLRPQGHRVLTLADLKSIDGVLDDRRPPAREIGAKMDRPFGKPVHHCRAHLITRRQLNLMALPIIKADGFDIIITVQGPGKAGRTVLPA